MKKLTILTITLLSCAISASIGCRAVKPTAKQIEKPQGATVLFSPQFRIDTAGTVWMYVMPKYKFYKLISFK